MAGATTWAAVRRAPAHATAARSKRTLLDIPRCSPYAAPVTAPIRAPRLWAPLRESRHCALWLLSAASAFGAPATLAGQFASAATPVSGAVTSIGSPAEDRLRLGQLVGAS